jgi:hypothetical protein
LTWAGADREAGRLTWDEAHCDGEDWEADRLTWAGPHCAGADWEAGWLTWAGSHWEAGRLTWVGADLEAGAVASYCVVEAMLVMLVSGSACCTKLVDMFSRCRGHED